MRTILGDYIIVPDTSRYPTTLAKVIGVTSCMGEEAYALDNGRAISECDIQMDMILLETEAYDIGRVDLYPN